MTYQVVQQRRTPTELVQTRNATVYHIGTVLMPKN